MTRHLLQHSFGFNRRIIGSEIFKLIHVLFQLQQLLLQFISQAWQSVSDVICELLV